MGQPAGPLCLRQGALELRWCPAWGACCAALRHHGEAGTAPTDILRPLPQGSSDPFASGLFALVPYSNRLFGQVLLDAADTPRTIALNRAGHAHPLHGLGWMRAWQLREASASTLRLSYDHTPDAHWPFAHGAEMVVRLSSEGLHIDLALHNHSDQAMPAGAGFHPWLVAETDASLCFDAQAVWQKDAEGCPTHTIAPAGNPRFDCLQERAVHGLDLDHCYANWHGPVVLRRPSCRLTVRLSASRGLGHLQVYRPPGQAWVCVEPVSHATGAFSLPACHRPADGVRKLQPGECMQVGMEIAVQAGAPAAVA